MISQNTQRNTTSQPLLNPSQELSTRAKPFYTLNSTEQTTPSMESTTAKTLEAAKAKNSGKDNLKRAALAFQKSRKQPARNLPQIRKMISNGTTQKKNWTSLN